MAAPPPPGAPAPTVKLQTMPGADTNAPTVKLQAPPPTQGAPAARAPIPGGRATAPATGASAISVLDLALAAVAMVSTLGAAVVLLI